MTDKYYESTFIECVLFDVLHIVFKNLSLKTLYRAEGVCKYWQQVARKEISRRNDIQSLVLPINTCEDDDYDDYDGSYHRYLQNSVHITDSLRSKPCIGLLFTDDSGSHLQSFEKFYLNYRHQFHNQGHIGVFDALTVTMGSTEITAKDNYGVGIMLPSTPKLKIDMYSPHEVDMDSYGPVHKLSELTDEAVNNLLTTEEEHNCFIFLSSCGPIFEREDIYYSRSYLSEFLNSIKRRCKPGTYSLWGGDVCSISTDICGQGRNDMTWSIQIRLSGPALKSWSIVLDCKLSNSEIETKLLDFRKSVKLNSNSIALAMIPTNTNESFEQQVSKTEVFRKLFPRIQLTGIYEPDEYTQVGVDSTNCESVTVMEHKHSITYLIITTK